MPLTLKDAKPCPFCGGTDLKFQDAGDSDLAVVCDACWAEGPWMKKAEAKAEAVARWNQRA